MSPITKRRIAAWTSAAVAATGLVAFGWSPTALLLLYWLETAVFVLAPLLLGLAASVTARGLTRGERLAAFAVVGFLLLVLGGFVVAHGALILFFDVVFHAEALGLRPGHFRGLMPEVSLLPLLRDPFFLASAVAVVGSVVADLAPQLRAGRGAATSTGSPPPANTWIATVGDRVLLTQAVLVIGGALLLFSGLPSAAALLLVVLKLWLDLRRARAAAG